MRVLQLGKYYYPYMGGIENHLYLLCNELKRTVDLDVVVCNSRRSSSSGEVDGVRVTRCPELVNVASTSICPSMPFELSRRRYDLLHFHFPHPMGVMSYLFGLRTHRHSVIVTYHSDIVKQERLQRAYGPFMRRVLDRADAIVCTSPNYMEGSDVLVPYRNKCRVIPYGIDESQFRRTPGIEEAAEAIRARFDRKPLVLAVGRLVYYKGFEYLVRAMREVDAQLLLVGGGPLKEALEQTARDCGVASRVHFVGEVHNQDLAPYYFASDVYALPSIARSEAFAIVQLEAMACGLPVVNTAIPRSGVPFVSRHGESGLTVPPKDAPALSRALAQILDDRKTALRFGEEGRARVRREFSKEVMAERMLALYEETTSMRAERRTLRAAE
ncbi:MAG: glycosyltransferase [Polyangiaceae bacterium]|jgi:glycosyltransferase involved in cell wall biosynthesis